VSAIIPALPVTYAARFVIARTPATDAMFTMEPPPAASMAGISYFIPRKVPLTLVRMPTSNSSGSMSASGLGPGEGSGGLGADASAGAGDQRNPFVGGDGGGHRSSCSL
jgi:hypothetical protein